MCSQIDALGDLRHLRVRIHARLHQWTKSYGGEDVDVAVQVLAVHGDNQVAGAGIECIEVTRETRVTEIECGDRSVDFVCQHRSRQVLVGRLSDGI